MLAVHGITVRLGGHTVLDGAGVSLPPRARVGLVGRNGAGKSTLLRVIAGALEPDAGSVHVPRGTTIGTVAQEAPGGDATPFETVLAADTRRTRLLADLDSETNVARLGDLHDRLSVTGAAGAPARAARILAGLGFDEDEQHRSLGQFSGGWRMRAALASVLFSQPDLLLLDEPSNHLDLESAQWLESFLRICPAMMIVVSHERDLLNNVPNHILHLEAGRLTLYSGGYDEFEHQHRERQARQTALRERQLERRRVLQAYVDRWRTKAHSARQAQSRLKALAKMEPVAEVAEDPSLVFDFPAPKELRPPLVVLEGAAAGYAPNKPVLSHLNMRIDPDDRIALVGRNGNGKTTLARLLSGALAAMAGEVISSRKVRVGTFAQHQIEELVPEETAFQHMHRALPDAKPEAVRAQLGRFGFSGAKVEVAVQALSGGERARLALALVTRNAPHLLILDEPTSHLDIDAREALVQALAAYGGAVVVVSHDRHLLELTADRLVLVANGTAQEFDGTFEDYLLYDFGRTGGTSSAKGAGPAPNLRKDERRANANLRASTAGLRQAVKTAEADMARLAMRRDKLDSALAGPQGHGGDAIEDLRRSRADTARALAEAEQRWLAASEELEAAMAPGQ